MHDHFLPYRGMNTVDHAFCNAHVLRELQALAEIDKEPWAMRDMLLDVCGMTGAMPRALAASRLALLA